jgi:uncharacterized protein YajQ (UPF0234 family)
MTVCTGCRLKGLKCDILTTDKMFLQMTICTTCSDEGVVHFGGSLFGTLHCVVEGVNLDHGHHKVQQGRTKTESYKINRNVDNDNLGMCTNLIKETKLVVGVLLS